MFKTRCQISVLKARTNMKIVLTKANDQNALNVKDFVTSRLNALHS